MYKQVLSRFGAAAIILSVWSAAIGFLPLATRAQDASKGTAAKDAAKDNDANIDKKVAPKASPTPPSKTGPLTQKEDPTFIGKRNINSGSDKLFGWLGGSQEKEIQIGRRLALEVEQQAKMVVDPLVTEYVNRVGQNVVLHSDAKIPFTIKVLDDDSVNAFALPGGFFFVNKGLLLAADNEAELAGVMAHEIAHVTARHAMENQGKGALLQYGMLAGILFGGGIASSVLWNTRSITQALAFFKFSRNAEGEADRLGVQYLYASGYDPTAMSTMFEKLASQNRKKPGTLSKLFSSHPQSVDRRDESLALVSRFPEKEEYTISTSEFQRVKGQLMRSTNAKAGVQVDFDQTDDSRPTLKKRLPDSIDPSSSDGESSSDGPPQLKKKNEPAPKTTPTPQP